MRRLCSVFAIALAACEPRIYVDDPLEVPDANMPAPDAETTTPPPPPPPPPPGPDLRCTPAVLDFGFIMPGVRETLLTTCTNAGDAPLAIAQLRFADTNPSFIVELATGGLPITLAPAASVGILVRYAPQGSGHDADTLVIESSDADTPSYEIPVAGGLPPVLRVDPTDVLVFPSSSGPLSGQVVLSNVGYGDLVIDDLEITGPNGETTSPAIDDFTADLTTPFTLCAPMSSSCTGPSSRALTVAYQNNDASAVDYAELHIGSNDVTDRRHIVILNAEDVPCLAATPVITIADPCVGRPIVLPAPNGGITYEWSWTFTPGAAPPFLPTATTTTTATFTPIDSGTHVFQLEFTNECGTRTQSSATIDVAAICP